MPTTPRAVSRRVLVLTDEPRTRVLAVRRQVCVERMIRLDVVPEVMAGSVGLDEHDGRHVGKRAFEQPLGQAAPAGGALDACGRQRLPVDLITRIRLIPARVEGMLGVHDRRDLAR